MKEHVGEKREYKKGEEVTTWQSFSEVGNKGTTSRRRQRRHSEGGEKEKEKVTRRETKKERGATERDLETCHHLLKVIA